MSLIKRNLYMLQNCLGNFDSKPSELEFGLNANEPKSHNSLGRVNNNRYNNLRQSKKINLLEQLKEKSDVICNIKNCFSKDCETKLGE